MSTSPSPTAPSGAPATAKRTAAPVLVDMTQAKPKPGTPIRWCFT